LQPLPPEERTCLTCGTSLLPEHRFCPSCGSRVADSSASVTGETGDGQDKDADQESPQPATDSPSWLDSVDLSETGQRDPSSLETREFQAQSYPPAPQYSQPERPVEYPQPQQSYSYSAGPPPPQDPGHPTWGTPETTVQPEKSNRTLWIILGIVAFIVLICCCILPLALMVVASFDTALQDELRVLSALIIA
jgi:hypothetical protein